MRRVLPVWLVLSPAVLLASPVAMGGDPRNSPAQPAAAQNARSAIDRARELARESADLLDRAQYADALDRATQAEALFHAPLHVEVIAESLEGLGRLAEAAAKYEELVAEPLPASAPRVFKEAQQKGRLRLAQLVSRVPSLLVVVRSDVPAPSATVDGKPIALGSGAAIRLDPGPHAIVVAAAGFRSFARTVTLPPRGGVVIVEATLERDAPQSPAEPGADAPNAASASPPGADAWRVAPPVMIAVGGAGLVVGAIAGGVFLSKLGGLEDRCPTKRCTPAEQPALDATRSLGNASTAGFIAGAAVASAGVVLLAVRPRGRPDTPKRAWIAPQIGMGMAGVQGGF